MTKVPSASRPSWKENKTNTFIYFFYFVLKTRIFFLFFKGKQYFDRCHFKTDYIVTKISEEWDLKFFIANLITLFRVFLATQLTQNFKKKKTFL